MADISISDPLTTIISSISSVLDRVLPDKAANDAAKAQLISMQVQGEMNNAVAQLQVNQAEATNQNVFVAGWRPFVGWACGFAFAYSFVLQPLLQFTLVACKVNFDITKLPVISVSDMMPVLLGMLGLGAMRSYDKTQGTGNGH